MFCQGLVILFSMFNYVLIDFINKLCYDISNTFYDYNYMNKKDQFINSALKLGLSANSAAVYVHLLKEKTALAPVKIINATRLHRQYVFNALKDLAGKDLVETSGYGRGIKYFAKTPEKAISDFEEKRLDALEGINKLMSLYKKTPQGVVEIFEGEEAVVANEIKLLKNQKKGDWLDIIGGAGTDFLEVFSERLDEYEKARKEANCKLRYIGSTNDESYRNHQKIKSRQNYEERYLENIDNVVNICVRPGSISFNIFRPETMSIVIKSPESISSQRALFEILWNVAKE